MSTGCQSPPISIYGAFDPLTLNGFVELDGGRLSPVLAVPVAKG